MVFSALIIAQITGGIISYKVCSVFTFTQSALPNLSLHSGTPEIKKNVC